MNDDATIRSALEAWQLAGPIRITPLLGGINSYTWHVHCATGQFVAKLVQNNSTFDAGLTVAEYLERAGLRAGGPVRTSAGSLTVSVGDRVLALLRFARGEPIEPTQPGDLRIWGETMAQFHTLLLQAPAVPAGLPRWPWTWLGPTVEHLGIEPWIRPAVERALAEACELEATRPLTLGIVHGDGATVLVDRATGERAVIDWGASMWGPLLYDIGSACWLFRFQGRRGPREFAPFLEAYQSRGLLAEDELATLDVFVRLRCAVQALYFSWRVANDIRTGIADPAENQRGLEDARIAWEQLNQLEDLR
jgi:Ser/Thr protein kinase RdoA (MazF antagonist)